MSFASVICMLRFFVWLQYDTAANGIEDDDTITSTIAMSRQFASASAWLSSSSSSQNVSNETKLELYGLFKFANLATGPSGPRPGIFSFEGRAKYDAWAEVASEYAEDVERAKERYVEIARDLGWSEGCSDSARSSTSKSKGEPIGFGPTVSVMEREAEPETNAIHDAAAEGDLKTLRALVDENPSCIDERDEYGFTSLHLAADRGHTEAVNLLLLKGADKSILDPDGQTALDIAHILGRDDVIKILQ